MPTAPAAAAACRSSGLTGQWLREAGFEIGQEYEVEVEAGRLVLEAL
jgi:hypothetical protein